MGTDELAATTKLSPRFERSALVALVEGLWLDRGAKLVGRKWSKTALFRRHDQARFGVALSPSSTRGWVTIVESTEYSLSMDAELLQRLGAKAPTWVAWSFDHSGIYGQKRFSKRGAKEPVDLENVTRYEALGDAVGWQFLAFEGVRPNAWKRFSPDDRTRSDPLPHDESGALESDLYDAVRRLDVDEATAIIEKLGPAIGTFADDLVFASQYPIEWPETADAVARLGMALSRQRPLPAHAWVRLLEVAAVRNDTSANGAIEAGLRANDPVEVKSACDKARERFAARKSRAAEKRFVAWIAKGSATATSSRKAKRAPKRSESSDARAPTKTSTRRRGVG